MPALTRHLGGPGLYIKRDDCTGLAVGGNKTRQLEFLIGEALAQGADTVITPGAVQSNHARQTAAAAAKCGLSCHLLLEERVSGLGVEYDHSGNVLLDQLFGAEIVARLPAGSDMKLAMQQHAATLRAQGRRPYIIPGGGACAVGALGYVACSLELLQQASETGLRIDHVVVVSSSSGTQAGLVAGLLACNSGIPVTGITIGTPATRQAELVHKVACETARHIGMPSMPPRESVVVEDDYRGDAYGIPTREMLEAVRLTARLEGILLDPVYTGKGVAGLLGMVRAGRFDRDQNVVFIHTGGSPALFAYREYLAGG
jgi:L-cysteate sulfo-lyase